MNLCACVSEEREDGAGADAHGTLLTDIRGNRSFNSAEISAVLNALSTDVPASLIQPGTNRIENKSILRNRLYQQIVLGPAPQGSTTVRYR